MPLETVTPPTLRFPEFNDDWGIATIDEIASFRRGSFPQPYGLRKWYDDENGFPFIQVFDVDDNLRLKDKTKRLISNAARELSVFVPKGSIVLTIQGSIGRIAITQYDACCDRTLLIFRDFKVPLAEMYFVYALHLRFEIEERIAVGGTIKTITKEKLRVFPISLPCLPEQRKIADFLTAVYDRIEQLSQKKALLEDYKKGVMQQLFTQALRFKDDHGKDFPDWEEKTLGDVCELVNGLTYTPEDVMPDGLLVLRSSNVKNGQIVFGDNVYVKAEVNEWNMSRPDDILICVRNGSKNLIGKNAIIPEGGPSSTHGAFMTVLRGRQNRFVFQLLQTDTYKRYVHINLGATINSINGSDLKKFKFGFPSIPEQTKIANFLTALDRKIESVAQQITQTQTFKKGLLQQMFV